MGDYLKTFLDLFYPRFCLHCNANLNDSREVHLCCDCKRKIPYVNNTHCIRCGTRLGPYIPTTEEGCSICREKAFHYDVLISATYYDGAIKTMIHKFKYSRQKHLSSVLDKIVRTQEKLEERIPNIDVIIPVPLYWLKKLHRGFNQSELLAFGIQKHFLKPIETKILCRIKNTASQTQLSKRQRRINIHNAFLVKYPKLVRGKNILLVDDVLTTGITASECSRKLKEAGAKSIVLLVLAVAGHNN
ncbi:MAG: ComF family protein [Candidatus Brocadiaceae bacterium]|nr:ComF family protein [Candidatus Brocadiaceae bacterium]